MSKTNIIKQIKDKLFGERSHELLVFCFFLFVSFCFWLLQVSGEIQKHEVSVSLRLDSIPSDVVIIDSLPSTLTLTIQDRGLALARQGFLSLFQNKCVSIDFSKYDRGHSDAEVRISALDIQRMVSREFSASTEILSVRPDTLHYTYNHGLSRTLPVRLAGTIKTSQQNYIQNISIEPDSVKVFAPVAVLDTMHAVYTQAFTLDGLQESVNYDVELCKHKFIKYDPQQVRVNVGIGYYTEKTVRVPIIGLNFPADKRLRTFPAEVSVTFRIESGRYHKITSEDFMLATTYEELLQNTGDGKLLLHLKASPDGVSDIKISPQEVDYLIEQVVNEDNEL